MLPMLNSEPLKGYRERIHARDPKRAHQLAQFAVNFANDRCGWAGWGMGGAAAWLPPGMRGSLPPCGYVALTF